MIARVGLLVPSSASPGGGLGIAHWLASEYRGNKISGMDQN